MTRSVLPPYFFVLDVESVGLHGTAFAVGWVVVDTLTWATINEGILVCDVVQVAALSGHHPDDIRWVSEHVVPAIADAPGFTGKGGQGALRRAFWNLWSEWAEKGAMLVADVPWPVEARFLMTCVRYTTFPLPDKPLPGPYPIIDVASVRLAKGFDPIATVERLPNELPAHNPLNDARQSARLLMEALRS